MGLGKGVKFGKVGEGLLSTGLELSRLPMVHLLFSFNSKSENKISVYSKNW